MKILKRETVYESKDHFPPIRIVQQDWERDAHDDMMQGLSQWRPTEPAPRNGFSLIVEVAKETDAMGKLLWKAVTL